MNEVFKGDGHSVNEVFKGDGHSVNEVFKGDGHSVNEVFKGDEHSVNEVFKGDEHSVNEVFKGDEHSVNEVFKGDGQSVNEVFKGDGRCLNCSSRIPPRQQWRDAFLRRKSKQPREQCHSHPFRFVIFLIPSQPTFWCFFFGGEGGWRGGGVVRWRIFYLLLCIFSPDCSQSRIDAVQLTGR